MEIGVLTERRTIAPWGLAGGEDGERGQNLLVFPDGRVQNFGAKNRALVEVGTKIIIKTPGGGGYGAKI
jgi:5-oxoprolinase (ATP-hydrolysing)